MLIIFTIFFMIILGLFNRKYAHFNIINLALIGGFGIIFAINIIIGGLPFIPYLILLSKYKKDQKVQEALLYDNLIDNSKNYFYFYIILFLILIICGIYFNFDSFHKLINKKKVKSK